MNKSDLSIEQRAQILSLFDTCYSDIKDATRTVCNLTDRGLSAVKPSNIVASNCAAYSFGLTLVRKFGLNVVRSEGLHQFV